MASRGRGRGRGGTRSYNREQLSALGINGSEPITKLTNPPPLFAPLPRRPDQIESSDNLDYLLVLKQGFESYMQLTYSYMEMSENDDFDGLINLPKEKVVHDWSMFPNELRPTVKAKRKAMKKEKSSYKVEKMEDESFVLGKIKTEPSGDDDEDETVQDEEDEENVQDEEEEDQIDDDMDEGTDYGNNYFDNGDAYVKDDDDALDDDPTY